MGRPPGETTRIVEAQIEAWALADIAEDALHKLEEVMRRVKRELETANKITEGLTPVKPPSPRSTE